jgi:hypothetical protein
MRVFLFSCLAAAVIAIGASVALYFVQEPVEVAYSTTAVRI